MEVYKKFASGMISKYPKAFIMKNRDNEKKKKTVCTITPINCTTSSGTNLKQGQRLEKKRRQRKTAEKVLIDLFKPYE